MARFGRYNVGFNRRADAGQIITKIIVVILTLFVGEKVINSVKNSINTTDSTGMFYTAYQFLGIHQANMSQGIIGVIGLIAIAWVVLDFVKVTKM